MSVAIRVNAHAKINLALAVTATRPDGFHDLRTVFQSLHLHDTITCRARRGALAVTCDDPAVPTGPDNLAWWAAARLWKAVGRAGDPHGVAIAIQKRIPMRAGLGGGSADAAATLLALQRLWAPDAAAVDLHPLAAGIGADAAYFLLGGTALGLGRGDDLYPIEDARPVHVVLALPAFGVSTAEAYRWFDEARVVRGGAPRRPADQFPAWPGRVLAIENDLEPPVARRHPEIEDIRASMISAGALASALTGSGSAVFGLFGAARTARRAAASLGEHGWRTLLTRTIGRAAFARGTRPRPVSGNPRRERPA